MDEVTAIMEQVGCDQTDALDKELCITATCNKLNGSSNSISALFQELA